MTMPEALLESGRGPSPVTALAYVGLPGDNLSEWREYATQLLGMQVGEDNRRQLGFRMDGRRQRLFVGAEAGPVAGWEVADRGGLDDVADRLNGARMDHASMSRSLCEQRCVNDGIAFRDPDGNLVEVVLAPVFADTGFRPGRTMRGFRTGSLGMGHFVLTSPNAVRLGQFYAEVLGFGLSDWCGEPFEAYFFHLNARHHSLAIIQSGGVGVHHVMIEMNVLDDVGQAYDLAQLEHERVAVTLGRHSNDHMTSFYSRSPSGPLFECGWGGLSLDPATWEACELEIGPSLWGHERSWLPLRTRRLAQQMRLDAAADGAYAAVHVHGDNYDVAPGDSGVGSSARNDQEEGA